MGQRRTSVNQLRVAQVTNVSFHTGSVWSSLMPNPSYSDSHHNGKKLTDILALGEAPAVVYSALKVDSLVVRADMEAASPIRIAGWQRQKPLGHNESMATPSKLPTMFIGQDHHGSLSIILPTGKRHGVGDLQYLLQWSLDRVNFVGNAQSLFAPLFESLASAENKIRMI